MHEFFVQRYAPSCILTRNEHPFHWQSQSITGVDFPTGQQYIFRWEQGRPIVLFVREFKMDYWRGGVVPDTV